MQNLKTRGSDGREDTRRRYRRNIIPHKCTKNFYFSVVFHKIACQRGVSIMRACGSRPPRRSVKNRRTLSISRGQSRTCSDFAEARKRLRKRTFDCFKSAVRHPIQRRRCVRPRNRFTAAVFNCATLVFLLRASAIHASMIALGLASVGVTFCPNKR